MMRSFELIEVVSNVGAYDPEDTIYATKPWRPDSKAVVAREPQHGGLPSEAASCKADYFIEVFIAKEFLEGWIASEGRPTTADEQCERLIRYAVYDA